MVKVKSFANAKGEMDCFFVSTVTGKAEQIPTARCFLKPMMEESEELKSEIKEFKVELNRKDWNHEKR